MKLFNNPSKNKWTSLCERPNMPSESLESKVQQILDLVIEKGDEALFQLTQNYDKIALTTLVVTDDEIAEGMANTSSELKKAIAVAAHNITAFHSSQKNTEPVVTTMTGVQCWRKNVPIENIGLYIPGGSAPLFSTILMLGIPAKLAGCSNISLCTPCDSQGKINPAILYTAQFLGISKIYKIGGAQAIAALAYGTVTIPKADKIFGPGNQYVTKAKELVQKAGIAIDLPAGPSEVLLIADASADAEFIAADLLAQAEHGPDSQVVLVTSDVTLPSKVLVALEDQLQQLPRKAITLQALNNSFIVVLKDIKTCFEFSNCYAPEHLIVAVTDADMYVDSITNAGSVFLGHYSCESAGDYASGTNHTLPTNGTAKAYSGVSLDSFLKKITFQHISKTGLQQLGKTIEIMAEAEELLAHKNAVSIRLKKIENEK